MRKKNRANITDLLALLVFGVFALCVAAVLLTGAKTYRNLTDRGTTAYGHRVAARYLTTRFHQAPQVQVEDFCGLQAMTIREEIAGKTYLTRVYCYDGHIRELFAGESTTVSPGDGEIVMEAQDLSFALDAGLLTVEITHSDGEVQQLLLSLPGWKEADP